MKWLFEHNNREVWTTSDEYDTREEAIAAGRKYFTEEESLRGGTTFTVGQKESEIIGICVNVDAVIEDVAENVQSEVGEVAETWLEYVPNDARSRLEENINVVFSEWLKKEGLEPTFYKIVNTEEVPLKETK